MHRLHGWIPALFTLLLAGCGGPDPTYTVSVNVSGLAGTGLVLQLNGGSNLPVAASGTVTFSGAFKKGSTYALTVLSRPVDPGQSCVATASAGVIGKENVTIQMICVTDTYRVYAAVSGVAGSGVTLQLNGGFDLSATSAGTYMFSKQLQQGENYVVTVLTQPTNPIQECTVAGPTGAMPAADLTLTVTCVNTYVLSGSVAGLSITRARTPLVLTEPGGQGQDVSVNSDGSFQFANRIPVGRTYNVTVKTAPGKPDMTCVVMAGTGTMPNSDLGTVSVSCQRVRGKFAYMTRFPYAVLGTAIATDGTLSSIESIALNHLPESITVDPSGQFLYVGSGFSQIGNALTSFRINPVTGQLTQIGTQITDTHGQDYLAVEPQGRFLFSSNLHGGKTNQGSISVYAIDAQTGQLSEVSGSPFDALSNPYSIAFDATGRYVYTTGDQLRGFSIDQTTGVLTPAGFGNITGARRVMGTPDGRFLYVRGQSGVTGYLKAFRVQSNGSLVEFAVSYDPTDIDDYAVVDPKGRYLVFVTPAVLSLKISVYAINATDGTLSRVQSPDWVNGGAVSFPIPAAFDPSGAWLFVNYVPGMNSITPGTGTYQVGGASAPLLPINAPALVVGDARAIAIR
jgi:6-phosphogluconolactonase (cycloisomerase 2 family)